MSVSQDISWRFAQLLLPPLGLNMATRSDTEFFFHETHGRPGPMFAICRSQFLLCRDCFLGFVCYLLVAAVAAVAYHADYAALPELWAAIYIYICLFAVYTIL